MDLRDYSGHEWNDGHLDKFKNELFKSKNDKQELKEIFRPQPDISLFYIAVQHSSSFATYLIEFAIENGVDSSILLDSLCGGNTLYAAVEKGNYGLVESILKYATDHGRQNSSLLDLDGESPFHLAIKMGDIRSMSAIFQFGVKNGVDVVNLLGLNEKDRTALECAILNEAPSDVMREIVTLATYNGLNANFFFQVDDKGKTPLHLASCKSFEVVNSVIKLARECGICAKSLIVPDETGNSPLHYAAKNNSASSVEAILKFATDSGIDAISLFQPNLSKRTPLHCAAMNCWNDTFDTLLSWAKSKGVPLRPLLEADSDGRTPLYLLHNLYGDHNGKLTKKILEIAHQCKHIPVILRPDRNGKTPLHLAVRNGTNCVVEAIIQSAAEHGKDMVQTILAPDDEGQTPLHIAAQNWSGWESARAIMKSAAELGTEMVEAILTPDKRGSNPLQLSLTSSYGWLYTSENIIRYAIKRGINWKRLIDTKDAALRFRLNQIFYLQIVTEPCIWSTLFPSRSFVALDSGHSSNTQRLMANITSSDSLPHDVLFQIFEYLDAFDLVNCEMVCRRWRDVLSRKIIWRKQLDREKNRGGLWQRFQKTMELEDERFLHCGSRRKCKIISRILQDLSNNWKTGKYQMKIQSEDYCLNGFKFDGNYITGPSNSHNDIFIIINKRTMRKESKLNYDIRDASDFQISGKIIVIASDEFIRVFDATSAKQVNEPFVPNYWRVANLCFEHGLLVALSESSRNLPKRRQLTVWRVNSSTDIQRLINLSITGDEDEKRTTSMAMDEHYIAVFLETQQSTETYFISTESWTILERSPTITNADGRILQYHRGLLITQKDNWIRLKEIFTENCREINLEPFGLSSECTQIGANSNYLVVMNGQEDWTKVGIFDLRKTSDCNTLLCCFDVPFKVKLSEVDETELICSGVIPGIGTRLVVIDFLSTQMPLSNEISWRVTLARDINKILFNS